MLPLILNKTALFYNINLIIIIIFLNYSNAFFNNLLIKLFIVLFILHWRQNLFLFLHICSYRLLQTFFFFYIFIHYFFNFLFFHKFLFINTIFISLIVIYYLFFYNHNFVTPIATNAATTTTTTATTTTQLLLNCLTFLFGMLNCRMWSLNFISWLGLDR